MWRKRLGTAGTWGSVTNTTGAHSPLSEGEWPMRSATGTRRLTVVPELPEDEQEARARHPAGSEGNLPLQPILHRPQISEAMTHCPGCGISLAIVIEAQ